MKSDDVFVILTDAEIAEWTVAELEAYIEAEIQTALLNAQLTLPGKL